MYLLLSKRKVITLCLVFSLIQFFTNCTERIVTPPQAGPTKYDFKVPGGFPLPNFNHDNQITNEGVALGKMLFYDQILSSNGMTCSSCHDPAKSFSSGNFVAGSGEKINVPHFINLSFNKSYFWNGLHRFPEEIPLRYFESEFFDTNKDSLINRLAAHAIYPSMFKNAFDVSNIYALTYDQLKQKISFGLIQYVRTLVSANSKFDQFRQKKLVLSPEEQIGMVIFFTEKGDCFHCHTEPLFADNDYHNNGLDSVYESLNKGRFLVTQHSDDIGKFRTPTLRNIELTGPYMHDGRFKTLDEVIDFYNSGVKNSNTIDPIMTKNQKLKGLNLNVYDKACLIAFLKTFTDSEFMEKHKN